MYRPGFQLPAFFGTELFPKEMQSPPVSRITVGAQLDRWDNETLKNLMEEARLTVRDNAADITTFFNGQRQNAHLAGLPQYRKTKILGNLYLDYIFANGTESVSIYVKPESGGQEEARRPREREILMDGILDVETEFGYWPFPGAQAFGNPPERWTRGTSTVAFYDPFYEHDSIENPLIAADGSASEVDDLRLNVWYTKFSWRAEGSEDYTPANRQGFDEVLLLRKVSDDPVGKTGIWPEMLSGKVYWEVEILELPEAVPESYTYIGIPDVPAYGNSSDSPLQYSIDGVVTVKYPPELNTFFNPVIGVVPKYMKDLSFDKKTRMSSSMIGLDPRLSEPRSIGAVRTSSVMGDVNTTAFVEGGIYVDISTTSVDYPATGRYFVCSLNAVDDRVDGEPMPSNRSWGVGTKNYRGNTVFQVIQNNGSVPRDAGGPINGAEIATNNNPGSGTSDYLGGSWFGWYSGAPVDYLWQAIGTIGGPLYKRTNFPYYPGESDPGDRQEIPGSILVRVEHTTEDDTVEDVMYGDYVQDLFDDDDNYLETKVVVPYGAEIGVQTPVLKGRGDFLAFYRDGSQPSEDEIEERGFLVQGVGDLNDNGLNFAGTGIDTGVNLGVLAREDRVMIAVDVPERKIWFGINGVWKGPDGREVRLEDIANGEGYATRLDASEGEEAEYFAAATVKYGPTRLRMHMGGSCKHSPPGGFLFAGTTKLRISEGSEPAN